MPAEECSHDLISKTILYPPKAHGEIHTEHMKCPKCGASLVVEFIKVIPMVDDIELSPEWRICRINKE